MSNTSPIPHESFLACRTGYFADDGLRAALDRMESLQESPRETRLEELNVVFPPAEGRVPWTEFSVGKGYVARMDSGPDIVIVEAIGVEARLLCLNLLGEPTRTAGRDCASWEIKQ